MGQPEQETQVALWENISRLDFEECLKWVDNLRAYLRGGTSTKKQEKAALRRLASLRETLDTLELVIRDGEETVIDPVDERNVKALYAKGHSKRLTFLLLSQYFTFRSQHHHPDVSWRLLEIWEMNWFAERANALAEITWLSEDMGMYEVE